MRIKTKHHFGDTRIISKFLFLPKELNGEIRWLERVKIKQKFQFYMNIIIVCEEWEDYDWVD
jgi:hypothetical protein